ncbi:target of EGR1 protein 1-like isoform X1 [Macrobrachium nipponense]|uniref:target of EGR1 protein 1-like isoform X1 n=1 Tax=Macrobrachium nipponense TaxID=159736 RepID=UPI0030C8376D
MKNCLPIIEVTEDNFKKILPTIKAAIKDASFLSIDCELTGLGDRKKLNYPEIDFRYKYSTEIARSYAVISLGLSCFTCKSISDVRVTDGTEDDSEDGEHIRSYDYLVQTFDIITLCSEDFCVEVNSHKFLLSHGFDFNKLYSKGILYHKGCDRQKDTSPDVREVFSSVLEHRKPVVIHNGLVDLIFLYQSFYADLPKKADTFAADLSEMFPCGVYDTKYISEFHQSMPATYLEYLYKKMQLRNARRGNAGDWHVRIQFPPYPPGLSNIDWHPYLQILLYDTETDDDGLEVCENFAFHGWCSKYDKCENSHNINKIVKILQPVGAKKRGNSKYSGPVCESVAQILKHVKKEEEHGNHSLGMENAEPLEKKAKILPDKKIEVASSNGVQTLNETDKAQDMQYAAGHRAGFDAFMTGFLFAEYITEHGKPEEKDNPFSPENLGLSEEVNKIYLMGKNFPFLIRTGTYASTSQNHQKKISLIRKDVT